MHIAYLGLGSNIGEKRKNIENAITKIEKIANVIDVSYIIETPAVMKEIADTNNQSFLNTAIKIQTTLNPFELLQNLQKIEIEMGRNSQQHNWQPRIIDIDILLFDDEYINTLELKIPHPEIFNRSFVLDTLLHINHDSKFLQASRKLKTKQPILCGIVNINNNSFSNDGILEEELLRDKIRTFNENLVNVIDIGCQSTRPNGELINKIEEKKNLQWALDIILNEFKKSGFKNTLPKISIDCFHEDILQNFDCNFIINDQSGKIRTTQEIISMHSLDLPTKTENTTNPAQTIEKIKQFLNSIPNEYNYIIDPGIGFGKQAVSSILLLKNIENLLYDKNLRIYIGHSRKSFLNCITNVPFADRDYETLGISSVVMSKVEFLRVHNPIAHKKMILARLLLLI